MNEFEKVLHKYWGYTSFRPLQEDIVRQAYSGRDVLALLPTGGGKSITFQVPAMAQEGICIVITPLIALMKDQVENLKRNEIKAQAIYSGMTNNEIEIALDNCIFGNYKFLYVSPERIGTPLFKAKVQQMNVNLVAVDEAHCISQWGYDFRPSYLKISELRELLPHIPVLALTATATPDVVDDIQDKLLFSEKNVLQKSFERNNLSYIVRYTDDKLKKLLEIAGKIQGTGVVYVRNRKKTQDIAKYLWENKISADYYHAGLAPEIRSKKQDDWKNNRTRVMVCTNAFGMGIDKPDVRFVVHIDIPDTLEAYFQEAGRAGRDEKKAWAVMLFSKSDRTKAERRIKTSFPERKEIRALYQTLCTHFQIPIGEGQWLSYDFNIAEFASKAKMNLLTIFNALKLMETEGYVQFSEDMNSPSRVYFPTTRDDLYKFQIANKNYDQFIKLLLRSYSGLFSDYVNINEKVLAQNANVKVEIIYKYLNNLKTAGIIQYIPRKNNPVITFTEVRLPEKSLIFSKENYEDRKNRYIEKQNAVLYYAETEVCRNQTLLSYFGEKESKACGRCDVCLKKIDTGLSYYQFEELKKQILEQLDKTKLNLEELVDNIKADKEKVTKVLRSLLDEELVSRTAEGNFTRLS